jgi:hypothetical protein
MVFDNATPRGEVRDVLIGPDGGVVWVREWQSNLIVNGLRSLIAGLLKGDTQQAAPLAFWAVGSGDPNWDFGVLPDNTTRQSYIHLFNETGRKAISAANMTFVGGSFTNQLQISETFDTTNTGGAVVLREFGLFAGPTANTMRNSGILINHRIHPSISMSLGFSLQRKTLLTF